MVYTNWYPGAPSMTASKYLKYSVAYTKPFEPGQRYRNRRDMELTIPGYRDIHRDLRAASEEIVYQRYRDASPQRATTPPMTLRNNPIGYTSQRSNGNTWNYEYVPSTKMFSTTDKSIMNSQMKSLYRYYGKQIYY